MEWLLANPQIHSVFSSLGVMAGDTYAVSSNALAILKEINCELTCEDQTLRSFRRAIGFGQNVRTDLIPLLMNVKETNIIDAIIRILVNLTVPVECLFSVDLMYRTDVGRHTIFELNKLLITSKEAFTDLKCTKTIIDYMKSILDTDKKLSINQCDSINNCLLLLRNILHIPENNIVTQVHHNVNLTSMQNTILWNLFTQSIDKLLIYLMSSAQRSYWGVTMVQLIAIMYKDQHVSTLQKLLNTWFEASLSESSEDNESNTSPPKQGSEDSSAMLTSDPTSDSSDNGGGKLGNADDRRQQTLNKETEETLHQVSRKGHEYQNSILRGTSKQQSKNHHQNQNDIMPPPNPDSKSIEDNEETGDGIDYSSSNSVKLVGSNKKKQSKQPSPSRSQGAKSPHSGFGKFTSGKCCGQKRECPSSQSELSDCGYGTQVENQESISTSSNEDDGPQQKPIHQKPPCNQKQRYNPNNKSRNLLSCQDKKDWRRKKLVKRSKSNLINMKSLVQHSPTDDDISNILKEFTVDFLLKGYGYLVQELHTQLLSDFKVQIDTSHFFWLVTYFLKFAAQLELDLEHISSVLSFDVISYLVYEGVSLSEQLELTSRQQGDLKPYLRRIHLVVTAIREFLQALEVYKKITHLSQEDRQHLQHLQLQITATEDLRCLFVLLIRRYNPTLHSKQYLQDIIVTNHILLLLLDSVTKISGNNSNIRMTEHISQFATVEIMHHYGLLLEDFRENGEYVNDCIFTMIHHIGGDLGQVSTLFQPVILKTFSQIWEAEYELCDDWVDLIEYVIHKFMNTPQESRLSLSRPSLTELTKEHNMENTICTWSREEMDTLYWYYVQSKKSKDIAGNIVKLFCDNGNKEKSRISIVQQLLQQDIITLVEYDDLMKFEDNEYQRHITKTPSLSTSTDESGIEIKDSTICIPSDDIQILKDHLIKENKGELLVWLQKILMECYFVKVNISVGKKTSNDILDPNYVVIMEPTVHHCILKKKSIPLVTWNTDQDLIMLYQPFVLLLHKLGFHLPVDTGTLLFVRIPDFWAANMLYSTALKLGPIDKSFFKVHFNFPKEDHHLKLEQIKIMEDTNNDVFAIPRIIHRNSIIRFTPDPTSTPTVPNWLQHVMRSKCTPNDRCESTSSNECYVVSSSQMNNGKQTIPSSTQVLQTDDILNDNYSAMKTIAVQDDKIIQNDRNSRLEEEYRAMIASIYENDAALSETASVASDLTRMYVSDEDVENDDIGPHVH